MVSCRTISESAPTHQSGNVQILKRCANKSSPGGDGRRHTHLPHGPQIGRTAQECTKVSKRVKPQESRDLVHQMLDDWPFQRQLSTRIQPTGRSIRAYQIFLRHLPGAWGSLNKRLPIQHEEWQGILVCNLRNQKL